MQRFTAVFLLANSMAAEQILLRDGTTVSGSLVSVTAQTITLSRCGRTEMFARMDVKRIDFSAQAPNQNCKLEAIGKRTANPGVIRCGRPTSDWA